jgi:hypothetical protein
MRPIPLLTFIGIFLCIQACDSSKKEVEQQYIDSTQLEINDSTAVGQTEIQIEKLNNPNVSQDAILEWNHPLQSAQLSENTISFNYNIKNFPLATTNAQSQYIHVVLNNEMVVAKNESNFELPLENGHYTALSYLANSNHISLKHYGAGDLRQFSVGKKKYPTADLTQPMLFFNLPNTEYISSNGENVLLDFYVVNAQISANEYKIKLQIDSNKTFYITEWTPYLIKNLKQGEHQIELQLIDEKGNALKNNFSTINRIVKIKS